MTETPAQESLAGFDYLLTSNAIRVSDIAGRYVVMWFWPQNVAVREEMVRLAQRYGGRFCRKKMITVASRVGSTATVVPIAELPRQKTLIRVWFDYFETINEMVEWARENGVPVVMDSAVLLAPETQAIRRVLPQPAETAAQPTEALAGPVGTLLPKMPLPAHVRRS